MVVPTKNAARTLAACLQSLRAQTQPCRVVVVDNDSTDGTRKIAETGADVVLDTGPERSAQRNLGARTFPAPVVGFVDADMVLQPAVVAEAVSALSAGAGSVIVPERTVGSGFWVEVRAFERSFYDGCDAIEAARFFRWDVFERAGGYDENLTGNEDLDLSDSARRLAPVARITAIIDHDEGTITYLDACRKKAYYAEGMRRYAAKHGTAAFGQFTGRPWLRQPHKLLNRYGAGLVALKAGEAMAVAMALSRGRARPTRRTASSGEPDRTCPISSSAPGGASRRSAHVRRRPHVGFVTESFLDEDGNLFEGGAERHLFHLARIARNVGAEATVYQRSSREWRRTYEGVEVVATPARLGALGRTLGRRAIADGCTHLHFQYLERVPWHLKGPRITATSHAVYWDIPYVDLYRRWYPGGPASALALPLWRFRQLTRILLAVGRCEQVLATDTGLLRIVQGTRPALRQRIDVVANFTDLYGSGDGGHTADSEPTLRALQAERELGHTVVLVPRNLSFVRGGAWLCEIVEHAADTGKDRQCHFFLTGVAIDVYGDASRYRHLLERRIDAMPAEARRRLHLLGGVPREAMPAAYRASDMALIPTFAHEGTSLAALEAMGAGLPVVATNVGGLNDVVRHGVTGFLVPADPASLAEAVVTLANDEPLRKQLGEEGRRVAEAAFTLARWRDRAEVFARRAGWAGGAWGS